MKRLVGRTAEYESLSPSRGLSNRSDSSTSSTQDPFADSGEINASTPEPTWGTRMVPPPSMIPGPDLDRYPIRRSLLQPGVPTRTSSISRYSNSQGSSESQRTTSLSFTPAEDSELLLAGTDVSPFGGYPPSDFPLYMDEKETDDYIHNPDPIADAIDDRRCHKLDRRGWGCLVAFLLLLAGFIVVFIVLPVLDFTGPSTKIPTSNDGTRLSPYDYGILKALRTANSLIDDDTPKEAYTHKTIQGDEWSLVFSDEFNQDGRTFYPGDDPIWEAVNLHYQATTDMEWYTPDAAYTEGGVLKLRMDAFKNHDLFYRSGMVQSWNKLCFTQGYIEVGARLPGNGTVVGLWPGLWTLGNLARPGYLATSEGVWPYSYNECDAGITANQSSPDGISYLAGQRLNKCTCPGSENEHPTPGLGRGAPEIDIIEGSISTPKGEPACGVASQSLQLAPLDIYYIVDYDFIEVYNFSVTKMNPWNGGPLQQAVSGITYLNPDWYEISEKRSFQSYGVEYLHSREDGYISWYVGKSAAYTMRSGALTPSGNVGWRDISKEPMSVVMNFGLSNSWAYIDWMDIKFPLVFEIDYVRIYQPKDSVSVTCDPDDYPTADYIKNHPRAYKNANATSWEDAGYSWPKNKLLKQC